MSHLNLTLHYSRSPSFFVLTEQLNESSGSCKHDADDIRGHNAYGSSAHLLKTFEYQRNS